MYNFLKNNRFIYLIIFIVIIVGVLTVIPIDYTSLVISIIGVIAIAFFEPMIEYIKDVFRSKKVDDKEDRVKENNSKFDENNIKVTGNHNVINICPISAEQFAELLEKVEQDDKEKKLVFSSFRPNISEKFSGEIEKK